MKKLMLIAAAALLVLSGCGDKKQTDSESKITNEQAQMFSTAMTASHDSKFFAITGEKYEDEARLALVNIFSEEGDSVYSFDAGSIDNFFGVCWEKDTYNIWVLTLDDGMVCYEYKNDEWIPNKSTVLPDYMK